MAHPWEAIGNAFLQHYYTNFDGPDRSALASLFKENSLLTYERETVQGQAKIVDKLKSQPRMLHAVKNVQMQPTPQNSILILVSGDIKLEGQTNELKFSEFFQLLADQNNNFYIQNNIFSLNYG